MTESLTIEKAMNRLFWRFGNGQFKPNQADLDSLTFMAEWINREKKRELEENTIFGKIYTYCFMREIEVTKDLKHSQQTLNELLKIPLELQYETFRRNLNHIECNKFRKHIGLSDFMENREREQKIIEENKQDVEKYFKGIWSFEQVKQALNNQITEAINRYKNLP